MRRDDEDSPPTKICIFGLGYVGLTLAVVFAEVGFEVLGVEVRQEVVDGLNRGEPYFYEPGLADRLRRVVQSGRLRAVASLPREVGATVFIITVGTPLGKNGDARLDMIEHVADEIASRLKPGDLVIARSTVLVGTTRRVIIPALERSGHPFDIAFCPERTVEGQALNELRWLPQIVGAESHRARARAAALFNAITPTVIQLSSLEAAEMVKLIDNTYRDVSFAFANEVARMCDAAGVSAAEVIAGGKFGYPRTSVPMPGPVGGPCLEKDPHLLAESLRATGFVPKLVLESRRLNEGQPEDLVARLKRLADAIPDWPARSVIALMGLAFKGRPANDDLRGTMARPIADALRRHFPGSTLRGFDAVAKPGAYGQALGLEPAEAIDEAIAGANLIIIANNHPCFQEMSWETHARLLARPAVIYDLWNHFKAHELALPDGVSYIGLGDGNLAI